MEKETLFVHFCGTDEKTYVKHREHFMRDVKYGTHIYINGLGSIQYEENDVEKLNIPGAATKWFSNVTKSYYTKKVEFGKNISTLEKNYKDLSSVNGYGESGVSKVCIYSHQLIREKLETGVFKNILFVGHSRGAAVALPSYLYYFMNEFQANFLVKNLNYCILFLDPVAGQTGNKYPLTSPKDWTTNHLYAELNTFCTKPVEIFEFYARKAVMEVAGLKVADFNPARRFLSFKKEDKNQLRNITVYRSYLGYRHSQMISNGDNIEKNEIYKNKLEKPYQFLVNEIINTRFQGNEPTITINKYTIADSQIDAYSVSGSLRNDQNYTDINGNEVYFRNFINSLN